jgi:hypothetical protein
MPTPRYDQAAELVDQLKAAGIKATRSATAAAAQLPCVLVPPPSIGPGSYGGPVTTWRLLAIAADPLGGESSWKQLDQLLDAVLDVLPVDRAEPTAYQLAADQPALPAYAITYTGS